jgi:hypothetical protein
VFEAVLPQHAKDIRQVATEPIQNGRLTEAAVRFLRLIGAKERLDEDLRHERRSKQRFDEVVTELERRLRYEGEDDERFGLS